MKEFMKSHQWLSIVCLVLICILCTGIISRLTEGFTNFDAKDIFAKKRNEENLLPSDYVGNFGNLGVGVLATAKEDGSILLEGTCTESTKITLATVTLPAGTYTLSGVSNATKSTCWLSASESAWIGDISGSDKITLSSEKAVTFYLNVAIGTTFEDGYTVYPVVNAGDTAVEFYA